MTKPADRFTVKWLHPDGFWCTQDGITSEKVADALVQNILRDGRRVKLERWRAVEIETFEPAGAKA